MVGSRPVSILISYTKFGHLSGGMRGCEKFPFLSRQALSVESLNEDPSPFPSNSDTPLSRRLP